MTEHVKRAAVVGLGVSNVPLAEYIAGAGYLLSLRDRKSRSEMSGAVLDLEKKGAALINGDGYLGNLDEDIIFRAPGMRPDIPEFAEAEKNGSIITTEAEFFLSQRRGVCVGITGSDGKTTTTTLTHKIIDRIMKKRGTGNAYIGGNIGIPPVTFLPSLRDGDCSVLELSSFQLQNCRYSPDVAVITNITPNHLNWHTGMDEYVRAKSNIFANSGCRTLITYLQDDTSFRLSKEFGGRRIYFSDFPSEPEGDVIFREGDRILFRDSAGEYVICGDTRIIKLPGDHNVRNYMAAAAAAIALGYRCIDVREAFEKIAPVFGGVKHRLELVAEINGIRCYNSSIDTSPTRTAAALSTFPDRNTVVICGGKDKHVPFAPLAETLCSRVRSVVLTGEAAPQIRKALDECPSYPTSGLKVINEPDFERAVRKAFSEASPGGRLILSPACSSFDAFPNFEARGERFREIILDISKNGEKKID